jgi:hypothetical protein
MMFKKLFSRSSSLHGRAECLHPYSGQPSSGAHPERQLDRRLQESRQSPPSYVLRKRGETIRNLPDFIRR